MNVTKILIAILIIAGISVGGYFAWQYYESNKEISEGLISQNCKGELPKDSMAIECIKSAMEEIKSFHFEGKSSHPLRRDDQLITNFEEFLDNLEEISYYKEGDFLQPDQFHVIALKSGTSRVYIIDSDGERVNDNPDQDESNKDNTDRFEFIQSDNKVFMYNELYAKEFSNVGKGDDNWVAFDKNYPEENPGVSYGFGVDNLDYRIYMDSKMPEIKFGGITYWEKIRSVEFIDNNNGLYHYKFDLNLDDFLQRELPSDVNIGGELWADKESHLISKIILIGKNVSEHKDYEIDQETYERIEKNYSIISYEISSMEFSDFGKSIEIDLPDNFITAEELAELQRNAMGLGEGEEFKNDNQRTSDLWIFSEVLDEYAKDHDGQYPKTNDLEKISDENSNIFKILKSGDYLSKVYKDPIPDKYYYGYKSDGKTYELSAVFENKVNQKCKIEGSLCIYRFNEKGEVWMQENK